MDCNKEEALRAKEIAEKKLQAQDYVSAKKIILKAQQLYPALEDVPQMLAVCEVHCVADTKLKGCDIDWYGVLQVDPKADEALIKKQYRKLALLLHPDKNKFCGAEAAFKLVGQAMTVLSNRAEREKFNLKRNSTVRQCNVTSRSTAFPTARSNQGQYFDQTQQFPYRQASATVQPNFWTTCPLCVMRFLFSREYLNKYIVCPNCKMTFPAKESHEPSTYGASGMSGCSNTWSASFWNNCTQNFKFDRQNFASNAYWQAGMNNSEKPHFHGAAQTQQRKTETNPREQAAHEGPKTSTKGNAKAEAKRRQTPKNGHPEVPTDGNAETSTKEHATRRKRNEQKKEAIAREKAMEEEIKNEALGKLKKERETRAEKSAVNGKSRKRLKKLRKSSSSDSDNDYDTLEDVMSDEGKVPNRENDAMHPRRSTRAKRNVTYIIDGSDDDDFVDFPPKSSRMKNKENAVDKKSETRDMPDEVKKENESLGVDDELTKSSRKAEVNAHGINDKPSANIASDDNQRLSPVGSPCGGSSECSIEPETFDVPDPDFHDFDKDRTEDKFHGGQIWAVYDEIDGMPRYYCRVNKVSNPPFKCQISWLEFSPISEDQEKWDNKLSLACGLFKRGKVATIEGVNTFSHIVQWQKGQQKAFIEIVPRKSDVWAIFKDWQNELEVPEDGSFEYEIVEILSDFSESSGVEVSFLVRVDGFKVIFKRHVVDDTQRTVWIPPNELQRFSHQIPAHRHTGAEGNNVPKDTLELDPAAVPPQLIRLEQSPDKGR